MLQETHCTKDRESWYASSWKGEIIHSIGSSNSRGVTIMISDRLDYKIIKENTIIDPECRYVILDVIIGSNKYILASYYGPNLDLPDVLIDFLEKINNDEGHELILGGDFNFVINVLLDKKGGNPVTKVKSRIALLEFNENFECMDIWRIKNPNSREYTWRTWAPPLHFL